MTDSQSAPLPFDDFSLPSGGVILKSSDGIEFKVYKNILALASPFFRDMFTLPREKHGEGEEESSSSDIEVVDVTETSSTLQILLRLIYPVARPIFSGTESDGTIKDAKLFVDGVDAVLAAALKYDMEVIVKGLLKRLIDAAETTLPDGSVLDDTLALRVFVLACRHGLKDEARDAIHASLKGRVVNNFIPELRDISAAQYFHLLKHHTYAVQTVKDVIQTNPKDHPSPYQGWMSCQHCGLQGQAQWWGKFISDVQVNLTVSPRSRKPFTASYLLELRNHYDPNRPKCTNGSYSDACYFARQNWGTVTQYIRDLGEKLENAIAKDTICLDEF